MVAGGGAHPGNLTQSSRLWHRVMGTAPQGLTCTSNLGSLSVCTQGKPNPKGSKPGWATQPGPSLGSTATGPWGCTAGGGGSIFRRLGGPDRAYLARDSYSGTKVGPACP